MGSPVLTSGGTGVTVVRMLSGTAVALAAVAHTLVAQGAPYPGPPPVPQPVLYGDAGTSHLSVTLGLGSGSGGTRYAAGVGYGYFVMNGVAPGVEALFTGGSGVLNTGLLLANLRLVPLRTRSTSLYVVGRGGRVWIESHPDLWGVGGSAGIIQSLGGRVGVQIGYQYLRLLPDRDCADLANGCDLQGLVLGLVLGF